MDHHVHSIYLPAYDSSGEGLMTQVTMTLLTGKSLRVTSSGTLADALKNNFTRAIEIMSSVREAWKLLLSAEYRLEGEGAYIVRDTKSAGMAIGIALINAHRILSGFNSVPGLTGTGVLRNDGTFDQAKGEDKKFSAAKLNMPGFKKFVTPEVCKNLFQLEYFFNSFNQPGG